MYLVNEPSRSVLSLDDNPRVLYNTNHERNPFQRPLNLCHSLYGLVVEPTLRADAVAVSASIIISYNSRLS